MSDKKKEARQKFLNWMIGFLTDLVVGIILLLIAKLIG